MSGVRIGYKLARISFVRYGAMFSKRTFWFGAMWLRTSKAVARLQFVTIATTK